MWRYFPDAVLGQNQRDVVTTFTHVSCEGRANIRFVLSNINTSPLVESVRGFHAINKLLIETTVFLGVVVFAIDFRTKIHEITYLRS